MCMQMLPSCQVDQVILVISVTSEGIVNLLTLFVSSCMLTCLFVSYVYIDVFL